MRKPTSFSTMPTEAKMKTLIIAPHVDDETIGCWSVLNDPNRSITVAWLYELTSVRKREALGIPFVASVPETLLTDDFLKSFDEVYVPSRRDGHQDHKEANARFRKWATHFYSVDMAKGRYLGDAQSKTKREALDKWFPSQASLWATDAKYYLFEDIQKKDYETYAVLEAQNFKVTVPAEYVMNAQVVMARREADADLRTVFEILLQQIPRGRVRLDAGSTIYESEA